MISGLSLWIAGAMLAQGAIALVLLFIMGAIRLPMVSKGDMRMREIALSRDPWPEHEKRVSNAFDNQFQLPVLFYVACGLSMGFGTIWIETVLAWAFVLTRIAHAFVHATRNHVPTRFFFFTAGFAVMGIFWLELLARLFFIAVWNRV